MASKRLSDAQRRDMRKYLIEGRFFTSEEIADMDDADLHWQYIHMHERVGELEAVSGADQTEVTGKQPPGTPRENP